MASTSMESALGAGQRTGREVAPDALPASQYLQERLQERRARNVRPKRLRQSDFGPRPGRDDDIFSQEAHTNGHASSRTFDSSPAVAESRNASEQGNSSKKRALGAKGMNEHMDRLTKENFALKLELDHRREHTAKLQQQIESMRAQAERAEQLHTEHSELLRINSQLVEELERRDKAVEEAMDIICELEDKVTDLEERRSLTRPSTANADSGYAGTETHEQAPPSSPPEVTKVTESTAAKPRKPSAEASAATDRLQSVVNAATTARARREPAVLSHKKQSTHALRSVYLESTQSLHPVKSFNSLLTRRESRTEDDDDVLNSPRLSVLSESSFPSLYSPKKDTRPDQYAWEVEDDGPLISILQPTPHLRQDSIKRVSQWMDERDLNDETPSKSNRVASPLSQQLSTDMLPNNIVEATQSTGFKSSSNASRTERQTARRLSPDLQQSVEYIQPFSVKSDRRTTKGQRPTSLAGPIFGEPLLPPTPESASTRMLRGSRSTMDDDPKPPETTPAAVKTTNMVELNVRTAPRQMRGSAELNNAFKSYIQRRNESALDDDYVDDDNADASSETIRDLSLDYDGFPDGGSIIMGTPSRFLKHGKPPKKEPYDGYELSPTDTRHPPLTRRQTSGEATAGTRKPSMSRAETSPMLHHASGKLVTTGLSSSYGSVTSPRSYYSGSSSSRTVVHPEDRDRTISPDLFRLDSMSYTTLNSPPRSRASPSPPRTLGQKAQGLLRRLSNTQRDSGSDREKSPLPSLTTAPSSLYVNDVSRDARRPVTSSRVQEPLADVGQGPPRNKGSKRPSVSTRTNTAPIAPTLPLAPANERRSMDTERTNIFRRSNSAKAWPHTPTQDIVQTPGSGGMKEAMARRRNSIKDAVTSAARRPWR